MSLILFYPYTLVFLVNYNIVFIKLDLFVFDFFYINDNSGERFFLKFFGLFKKNLKKSKKNSVKEKNYSLNIERLYYIINFFLKHIYRFIKVVNIKKLGVDICIGLDNKYLLSQLNIFNIMINNILPDGVYTYFEPDFEAEEKIIFYGRGKLTLSLIKLMQFLLITVVHPAVYKSLFEYYKYSKENM
ncbi:MAG: hypothetical protein ACQESP_00600 [Candidatus Muiribacteriota bacterium]